MVDGVFLKIGNKSIWSLSIIFNMQIEKLLVLGRQS